MPETVTGVLFTPEEVDTLGRALERGVGVLDADEKGRDPARRFLNRVAPSWHAGVTNRPGREPLYRGDLEELEVVLWNLRDRWRARSTERYWREVGAPGGEDAIRGLASEFAQATERAMEARRVVTQAWLLASVLPAHWLEEAA